MHAVALRMLDLTPSDRRSVVESMFRRRRRDAVSYWLQLLLSMGIATVGLVLDSTAVVIGAMLIAPLMGPIVELGMGLVVGSPVLTLRSFGRMAASVVAVAGGAALLTVLLPFHEVTGEVASRTTPTALDLLLAILVALAAAYTTARPGLESTSAAVGTAIGIALVPPLCVIGFGIGVRDADIAGGATLLLLTNLTAILLVSVIYFWTLGFERVREEEWESGALEGARPTGALRRALEATRAVFGSRHSRAIRVGLPLVLAAAVFVPLSRALEQVAWEVGTRGAVARIINQALDSRRAVQSQVSVSRGAISTHLFLVGSAEEAAGLEPELLSELAAATGVVPAVRVMAVPDADALRQLAGTAEGGPTVVEVDMSGLRRQVDGAVPESWPDDLGALVAWRLEVPDSARARVLIDHLGAPVGDAAEALLARAISQRVGERFAVSARAHPSTPTTAPAGEGANWPPTYLGMVETARAPERLHACVSVPAAPGGSVAALIDEVRIAARTGPPGRVHVDSTGVLWSAGYSDRACAPAADTVPNRPPPAA